MAGAGSSSDEAAPGAAAKRKPGTVIRDLRRHHLLLTQEQFAKATGVNKRTVKRVEHREPVREKTKLALVRGLDRLLSNEHGEPIRLAVSDVFGPDHRALLGSDRNLPLDERVRSRKASVTQLLEKRVARALMPAEA